MRDIGVFPFVTKHLKELDSEYGVRRFLLDITNHIGGNRLEFL
jgi:hypothetical protein